MAESQDFPLLVDEDLKRTSAEAVCRKTSPTHLWRKPDRPQNVSWTTMVGSHCYSFEFLLVLSSGPIIHRMDVS